MERIVFWAGLLIVVSGWVDPPLALGLGLAFGMLLAHPYEALSRRWAKILLQASVVALGFGMNIREVVRAGRASFAFTAIGIAGTLLAGILLGRLLRVRSKAGFLVAIGTAICGGSAIAAIAPILNPDEEELAMSMGTVFSLNALALLLFPAIGLGLHLTQTQFGLWAALAIHDTSSVVGAAAKYGSQALTIGTIVKLTRAMWIVPVALALAVLNRSSARVKIPWFIALFCVAAAAESVVPQGHAAYGDLNHLGHIGLACTLFLIGSGISRRTLKQAGASVMIQGVVLWMAVAGLSLLAIELGWIHL